MAIYFLENLANTSTWYRYLEKIQNSPFMDLQNTWWAPTCFKYLLLGWSYIITIPSCRRERVLLENNLRQVLFSINTTMSKIVGSIDLIRVQIFLFCTMEYISDQTEFLLPHPVFHILRVQTIFIYTQTQDVTNRKQ